MSEYELIEIAKRFRALEDSLEEADIFLAAYAAFFEDGKTKLTEARAMIEKNLEACRDDMNAMQEKLRAAVKV
jgi:DNA-binding transcriptional MerR regulator